jgi:halimadienyl-diphosphate synthase
VDLEEETRNLLRHLDSRMGPSIYDAAWMARLPAASGDGARWPKLLDWLLERQREDGSWGGEIPYYHDRILCTLSAILALQKHGDGQHVRTAIARGERYIWHNLHRLRHDPYELVGFELIFPTLLTEALRLDMDLPVHTCGYGQIRREKLALIPPAMLYSPRVTTVHSLEFLGNQGDVTRLQQALATNGSLGNSPATTVYYLLLAGSDGRAMAYLEDMVARNGHVVYLYPCRIFQLTWALYHLSFCQPLETLTDVSTWKGQLLDCLSERGIGLDPTFGIEDGDITSVTTYLLAAVGNPPDPAILARFEDRERRIFRTYEYERNVSISTNLHALEAINLLPDYPDRRVVMDHVLAFLLASRTYDTYWTDKWNASPYYVTAHVLAGMLRVAPHIAEECRHTVDWIVHTQREDGSWGFFDRGTLEETAYALIGLLHYNRHSPVDRTVLQNGARFLYRNYAGRETRWPELYIGKCLFAPVDVLHATVLAAMMLYEEDFAWPP